MDGLLGQSPHLVSHMRKVRKLRESRDHVGRDCKSVDRLSMETLRIPRHRTIEGLETVTTRPEGSEMSYDAEGRLQWGRKAAGILIQRSDTGQFLLVLRSVEVMDPGVLGIPGGRVEPDEEEEAAALIETEEELGPLPTIEFVDRDVYQSGDFTYITFLAVVDGQAAQDWIPTLNWENDAWLWAGVDELPDGIHPNVLNTILKWTRN